MEKTEVNSLKLEVNGKLLDLTNLTLPQGVTKIYEALGKPIPTAYAIKRTETQWTIRCPYCDAKHFHGPGEGHRVSHCNGHNAGYNIVIRT